MRLQEEFDRERDRLVRERHEIKISGGGVGMGGVAGVLLGAGGIGGRLGPNDDDNVGFATELKSSGLALGIPISNKFFVFLNACTACLFNIARTYMSKALDMLYA